MKHIELVKAKYRKDARALTWEEKVASIGRMMKASREAKEAMKKKLNNH